MLTRKAFLQTMLTNDNAMPGCIRSTHVTIPQAISVLLPPFTLP